MRLKETRRMKWLERLFCNHMFIKSVMTKSERNVDHNYIYDYECFKCEKCGYHYTVKTLNRIERGYYINK